MSQYISIPLINEHIRKKEAQDLAKKIINSDEIISINPFYYPYYHYNVNCKLPFLFGGKRITINAATTSLPTIISSSSSSIQRRLDARQRVGPQGAENKTRTVHKV